MNINGNFPNWIHGYGSQQNPQHQHHQLFYTTMNQSPHGYYPYNMEKTNYCNIINKNVGFSNQQQQRNHHTTMSAESTSNYINIKDHQGNRYLNNCNTKQTPNNNHHQQQQQIFQNMSSNNNQHQQHNNAQNMSSNNYGFINGIKNFVNGFINPTSNCNFSTEHHHRNYNQNYRNTFMKNKQQQINNYNNMRKQQPPQHCQPETHIHTALFFNLTVEPKMTTTTQLRATDKLSTSGINESSSIDEVDHCQITNKSDNIAIFTLDDFPELPAPKQQIFNFSIWNQKQVKSQESCPFYNLKESNLNNNKTNNKNRIKENKISSVIVMTPPRIDDDSDDNCNFNNINTGCSSSNSFISTNTENVQQYERKQNNRKESECDSEDSFIIFTNQSPSNYDTIINLNYNNNKSNNAGTTPFRPNKIRRERQISECSDDSFIICFTDDVAEGIIEFSDGISSSDDDDEDDDTDTDFETDDDDEEDDEIDDKIDSKNSSKYKVVNKINNCNQKTEKNIHDNLLSTNGGQQESQPDSGFDERKEKKVHFNLNLEIHTMHTWNFAYRAARKGHWENYVRDRSRFGKRIERLSSILNPILDNKHRENIYKLRFCDNNDTIS